MSAPAPPVSAGDLQREHCRLLVPAIGAWGAAAGCTYLTPARAGWVAAGASAAGLVVMRRSGMCALLALGVFLGAAAAAWHVHGLRRGPVAALAKDGAEVDVVARMTGDPASGSGVGAPLTIVDATATRVRETTWLGANAPILVLSYAGGWSGLLPGQVVVLSGRLSPPRRGDDIAAVLEARGPPVPIGRPPWWQRAAGRLRAGLRQACASLPADARGLLPGLVDGDVSAVPIDLQADMRSTGLTHLEAVSGENVSIVLAVTIAVARAIGLRRRSQTMLTSLALAGFVVLARPSPSVLRAAVMGAIGIVAVVSGRHVRALPALGLAVLVLVCVNPFLARSIGFVLSVVATGAIVTVAPAWTRRLETRMPRGLAAAIAVPAAAQLACTPVLVLAFGQLTPYAVPANLLAAPAVGPATVVGVCAAVLSAVSVSMAAMLARLAAVPTVAIGAVARVFAALPGAGLRVSGIVNEVVVLAVVGAPLALVLMRRRRRAGVGVGTAAACMDASGGRAILGACPPP